MFYEKDKSISGHRMVPFCHPYTNKAGRSVYRCYHGKRPWYIISKPAGWSVRMCPGFWYSAAALDSTKALLQEHEHLAPVQLLLDSHAHMSSYAEPGTVSCIVFNLGYLPSGDHSIATHKESTIVALEQGLELLKTGGCISLCIYSGGDSGFEERDGVLDYLKGLDSKKYLVVLSCYYNRPNHPPIPVIIYKM